MDGSSASRPHKRRRRRRRLRRRLRLRGVGRAQSAAFVTGGPLVPVQANCNKATGARLRFCAHLSGGRRTTQVWLCVFALSFLISASCGLSTQESEQLQQCLGSLTPSIEESRAMLYAPSVDNIQAKCHFLSLNCYFLELVMVLDEEEVDVDNIYANCIQDFIDNLALESDTSQVSCPPCEAHALGNITTFLHRLKTLLQAMALNASHT
ncbi:uncharacterized protein LOC133505607 isoform X1 [Syngnathoides biaculeatus]|uniref:uncharacterized protein LOC133505607 isoform X1 n=1 Tax=Syngnathoides biaculeatus TaxID=300417 RepID=UPI002ADD5FBB|nr:uncharacterized protein LOC133505607 isoform X1 [Syngnathoides biaculeatus]